MTKSFQAVIETNAGVFRATAPEPRLIAITEYGIEGILDFIHLPPGGEHASSPANLPTTLRWWVLKNVRGTDVVYSYLY